jgi:hypothetical protein
MAMPVGLPWPKMPRPQPRKQFADLVWRSNGLNPASGAFYWPGMKFLQMLVAVAIGAGAVPLRALDVTGYEPAVNDRFAAGYPNAPVPNQGSKFVGGAFDWTCVGWDAEEPTHSVTLISPRHFIYATHQQVGAVGEELAFVGRDGALHRYKIEKLAKVPFPPDQFGKTKDSDLSLGTLSREVPASHGVTPVPVAHLGADLTKYLGQRLFVYGHTAKIGTNEVVDAFVTPGEAAEIKFLTKGLITGMAVTESGDSGSPSFIVVGGKLAAVGIHSEVGQDTFLQPFIDGLNKLMAADGQSVSVATAPMP